LKPGSILRAGLRWSWVVALATLIGAASAFGVSNWLPRVYEAETTLLVGSLTVTDPSEQLGYQQLAQTYASVVRTNLVLQAAIDRIGLDARAGDLRGSISADTPGARNLVIVRASAATAEDAAALAAAIGEEVAAISRIGAEPNGGLAVVIEAAEAPGSPASPRVTLNVAVGAALGLMAGLLLVYLMVSRRFERSVTTSVPWGPHAAQPPPRQPVPPPRRPY
jgi:polysaccharide biosynthesis transport protein